MNYIIIDGSYFIICRYFALLSWAKRQDKIFAADFIPHENEVFIQKFVDIAARKINELPKKLGFKGMPVTTMIAKDCPRSDIWRMTLYDKYKSTRVKNQKFSSETFFPLIYNNEFFKKSKIMHLLQHPKLEGDDCAAITAHHIYKTDPSAKIWLITNDMDYLQLANDRISIFNLQFKDLTKTANSNGNNQMDLFCKITSGDKSDNIPAIFNGCGVKTAIKYFNDMKEFEKILDSDETIRNNYERNCKLVDFNCIPQEYVNEFKKSYAFF